MFFKKSCSNPLERNEVYIPIATSTSMTSKYTIALSKMIGLRRHYDVICSVPKLAENLRVNVLLLQFKLSYKSFRQGLLVLFRCFPSIHFSASKI